MGDRVAEYLNFTIMMVMMVAVIMLGASFMFLGRKMQNMFFDKVSGTYAENSVGLLKDITTKDYEEMPVASALALLYSNQDYIYDVYDYRDVTTKEFVSSYDAVSGEKIGSVRQTTHLNLSGRSTANSHEDDINEKFRIATTYFSGDLNKSVKLVVKVNPKYNDYFDIYLHDIDCRNVNHTQTKCKNCDVISGSAYDTHTGNCTYNRSGAYSGTYDD